MVSPHLETERQRLLEQFDTIRRSGPIAPPDAKIVPDFLTPKNWMVNSASLPMRDRKLGQAGSPRYMDWVARIQRRDQLQELEQQLEILQTLIRRQTQTELLFADLTAVMTVGDRVEFNGQQYYISHIGATYAQLRSREGAVIRCKLDELILIEKAIN